MKNSGIIILVIATLTCFAQRNAKPRMEAMYAEGYYLNNKNDTVHGMVQINPENPTDFYRKFAFKGKRSGKPKVIEAGRVMAYGFGIRHFVLLNLEGQKLFAERLTDGRLRLYEYLFLGKKNGYPEICSDYFIRDSYAGDEQPDLKKPRKLSHKFYKRTLKPYFQEQPMLWKDLDKYTFERDQILRSIKEFNRFYKNPGH